MVYDVGIVGAGPAGATLARLLADRYQVLLLDSSRHKCCGGILSVKAQRALTQYHLTLPKQVIIEPQPAAVTIMDWDNQLVRSYPRRYINIDRPTFDHWLLSLVPQSVDIRQKAIYKHSEINRKGIVVQFSENREPKTAQVRWLVGADGAFSMVRREFFSHAPISKRYVAVQHWFERDAVCADSRFGIDVWKDYVGVFDSALTDFYLWMIPKNGQLILGGAFPLGTDVSKTMKAVTEKLKTLGLQLGSPFKREAGQILRPLHRSALCLGNAQVILAGEASGLISPSSAEGISGAIAGAFHLAKAFQNQDFDPLLYRQLLNKRLWRLWLNRLKIPLMYHPPLRKYVMLSGVTALRTNRRLLLPKDVK